jgi:hypothetical protein
VVFFSCAAAAAERENKFILLRAFFREPEKIFGKQLKKGLKIHWHVVWHIGNAGNFISSLINPFNHLKNFQLCTT